jgi:hypothetical protein
MKKVIIYGQYLAVYLQLFFEIEPTQAEFFVCYATFDCLQMVKKSSKKKGSPLM